MQAQAIEELTQGLSMCSIVSELMWDWFPLKQILRSLVQPLHELVSAEFPQLGQAIAHTVLFGIAHCHAIG